MPDPASPLSYQSPVKEPRTPRAWWVYALIAIYLLLLITMLLVPAFAAISEGTINDSMIWAMTIYACGLTVCGLSLVILPVRAIRRRPVSRRSIWFPVIGSGLLAGTLVIGGGFALGELLKAGDVFAWGVVVASVAVWIAWSILFLLIGFRAGPECIGGKLYRFLIAGSVLELLVAVPSNVIVRRRHECCAGIETGIGICIGVSVMIIALGPGVLIL
jgi:hypothetical protein